MDIKQNFHSHLRPNKQNPSSPNHQPNKSSSFVEVFTIEAECGNDEKVFWEQIRGRDRRYSVTLVRVDIDKNLNSYHRIQLLESKTSDEYVKIDDFP